jgi:predicted nucleotidyltransferase
MVDEQLVKSDPILAEMVRRLVAAFHPDHIYLYGSRARGEAGPDSDYDLLLVVPASQVPRYRRDQQAFRALCGLGVSKEVIVLTRAEFEAGRKVVCSLPATVLREGSLLYAT